MTPEYYILEPNGRREGPYAEEEVLDLLESGALNPEDQCLDSATGRVCEAGAMFRVIAPDARNEKTTHVPVPWTPAPLPDLMEQSGTASAPDKTAARVIYRGNPCVLTYWRSGLAAAALFAGGFYARSWVPAMLAAGLIGGSAVILSAVLHRLSSQFLITGNRVEVIEGLISRSSRELCFADIRAINVTRRGLTGWLGIGTVTFVPATGTDGDVVFSRVWAASKLKKLIRRLQDVRSVAPH